jgi:hypothetical protein
MNRFEAALLEDARLVRVVEALEDDVEVRRDVLAVSRQRVAVSRPSGTRRAER